MRTIDSLLFVQQVSLLRDTVSSFDEFPFCLPVIRNFDTLAITKPVSFLVGENRSHHDRAMLRELLAE